MGLLAVDVKHFNRSRSGGFAIDIENDLKFTMVFEDTFQPCLWYAIKNVIPVTTSGNSVSAIDAIQFGDFKKNRSYRSILVDVDRKHFTEHKQRRSN